MILPLIACISCDVIFVEDRLFFYKSSTHSSSSFTESTSFLYLPPILSSDDPPSSTLAPLDDTPPPPNDPPPIPSPPCKPPITRVYTRHSANHLESPSSPSSASLDAPVFVDSNATDESQVGPSYNLRDRTTIQPPNKLGFPRASAILEDHPLIMSLLSFRNGRLICLRSSLHLSAQVLGILFHYHLI